jgi:hypothetical protein
MINLQTIKMMKCIICHTSSFPQVELMQNSQTTIKSQKGHVQYSPNHECTLTKKHLLNEHQNDFVEYKIELESIKGKVG